MRKAWTGRISAVTFAVAVGFIVVFGTAPVSAQENEDINVTTPEAATFKATNGIVKCTAAIRSDGSVAACKHCNPSDTSRLGTGTYAIGFDKPCLNILANNGFSRWVQADTLHTSSTSAYCTTADKAGDANAVFVKCQDSSGPVDTSFFLFVAR
jgi:hypothetical protein